MSYEVRCACGKAHAVSTADAGASLHCACGQSVDVPPLHMLRASVGEMGVSPVVQLQAMLLQNELPGTTDCACCHRRTDDLIRASVRCEHITTKTKADGGLVLAGCLAFGWLGGVWAHLSGAGGIPVERGREVSFVLPVRVCEVCARDVTAPESMRRVLDTTPIYAALFEQYPNASVSRLD